MQAHNILVTGGAGFIGSYLVSALCERGHSVIVYDSLIPQIHGLRASINIPDNATLVKKDIRDKHSFSRALDRADVVYHLAALTGVGQSMYEVRDYVDINCGGTANLLQCIIDLKKRMKKIILASSRAVYGEGRHRCNNCGHYVTPRERVAGDLAKGVWDPSCSECGYPLSPVPVDEGCEPRPGSIYAVTKLAQEEILFQVGKAYQIPAVALRFFNVYGPGQSLSNPYTGVLSVFASILAEGGGLEVYEDGKESRDFVNVRDVVQACISSMECDVTAGIYNIGSGEVTTIHEIAVQMTELFHVARRPVITGQYRVGDVRHCLADISRARRELSYQPNVRFTQGLNEFVRWARKNSNQQENLYLKAKSELIARGLYR